jgi:hypothetical protein
MVEPGSTTPSEVPRVPHGSSHWAASAKTPTPALTAISVVNARWRTYGMARSTGISEPTAIAMPIIGSTATAQTVATWVATATRVARSASVRSLPRRASSRIHEANAAATSPTQASEYRLPARPISDQNSPSGSTTRPKRRNARRNASTLPRSVMAVRSQPTGTIGIPHLGYSGAPADDGCRVAPAGARGSWYLVRARVGTRRIARLRPLGAIGIADVVVHWSCAWRVRRTT